MLAGCDESQSLTSQPISMNIYVDTTFSNEDVAAKCLPEVMSAATLAAASRGFVDFHVFDGDPYRRRGLSANFSEEVPRNIRGTSDELHYLEEQAEKLEGEVRQMISQKAVVGGTPLIELLDRIAEEPAQGKVAERVFICTDGLFTDVNPLKMSVPQAESAGRALPPGLKGSVVDFTGLDASAPGRGRRVQQTKPLVEALLDSAGAKLGNWGDGLDPQWRDTAIEEADNGSQG